MAPSVQCSVGGLGAYAGAAGGPDKNSAHVGPGGVNSIGFFRAGVTLANRLH
jgi:hypothetical protein